MKLVILCVTLLASSAFALPVPDEEVSPVVQSALVPEVKSEVVIKPEDKPIEVIKPESRAADELNSAAVTTKVSEEKKLELPASAPVIAPDAEIPQATLTEKKEEKKADKQVRIEDNQAEEVKALPVVEAPAAGLTEQKPIIEETKPIVQETKLESKLADVAETPAAEQKKEELSASENLPIIKSDIAAPLAAATLNSVEGSQTKEQLKKEESKNEELLKKDEIKKEELKEKELKKVELKKEELPARQERGGVEQQKVEPVKVVDNVQVIPEAVPVAPVVPEVFVPAVKSLAAAPEIKKDAQPVQAAEQPKATEPEVPVSDLKLSSIDVAEKDFKKKIDETKQTAGDISQQSVEESTNVKTLKPVAPEQQAQAEPQAQAQEKAPVAAAVAAVIAPEAKKIEEAAALETAAAAAPLLPIAEKQQQNKEEIKPAEPEPLKKLDDKKSSEEKKSSSEEKKSSNESTESTSNESAESKEDKSE